MPGGGKLSISRQTADGSQAASEDIRTRSISVMLFSLYSPCAKIASSVGGHVALEAKRGAEGWKKLLGSERKGRLGRFGCFIRRVRNHISRA